MPFQQKPENRLLSVLEDFPIAEPEKSRCHLAWSTGQSEEAVRILQSARKRILAEERRYRQQLDALDVLIWKMKKGIFSKEDN